MTTDTVDDMLEHYGVKGMKWGVRRQGRISTLSKVGAGKGSRMDKFKAYMQLPFGAISVAKAGGLQKAAANRADRVKSADARIAAGERKAKDLLTKASSTRIEDLAPSRRR